MAVVKFVTSGSPMNNIFPYIMKKEKTEQKLISGINCVPENAMQEFIAVKKQFGKTEGRQYYHVVQSFSPDDNISPETAHEIGLKFAEYFGNYQMVVTTHIDRNHIHNHIVFNSVNLENGKKFHQSRDEMIQAKEYSNKLCQDYGLTLTEAKATRYNMPKWKRLLKKKLEYAMKNSSSKEEFIFILEQLGVTVNWQENRKYITFTTDDKHKCRDNKLFDERFLKENLEIYFELGGCDSIISEEYQEYETPQTGIISDDLFNLIGNLLDLEMQNNTKRKWMPHHSKKEIEKLIAQGQKITNEDYDNDYDEYHGFGMSW
ncbi:MAG: relaxase/mobilization nuclease domain-containing protein [Acetobacter sp.]|nr:relaxase/mobilization nuclease domain-containing protein [Bacteroides sp.]MCM1340645.1 relaxase/mobilization nuclease domain-containing protein [Acetobacter sp.]MCM1433756.1 relaxase/mobilization nuclease domain-containing protein [Clostridiales bacterium]